jgi:hypothetical protein
VLENKVPEEEKPEHERENNRKVDKITQFVYFTSTMKVIKSKKIRNVGNVTHMGEISKLNSSLKKYERNRPLLRPNRPHRNGMCVYGQLRIDSWHDPVAGSGEHINKVLPSFKKAMIIFVGLPRRYLLHKVNDDNNNKKKKKKDRICGLVVRVLGYRSGGPGSIPGTTRKKSSGSGTWSTQPREYN